MLALESPFPPHGALRVRILEFMRGLGAEICLIVFGDTHAEAPLPAPFEGVIRTVPWPGRKPLSRIRRLARPPDLIANFTSEAYAAEVRKAVAEAPDLVLAVGLHVARYLELVPKEIPRLFDDHDVVWMVHRRKAQTQSSRTGVGRVLLHWEALKVRAWERRLLQHATRAIAISETDAVHLRRLAGTTPIHVVGPTVPEFDVSAIDATEDACSDPVLVLTGVFSYEPNITGAEWFCRQVLPILQSQIGFVKVHLVGRSADEHVAHLANIPGVTVVGEVPSIVPYIRSATISIVPLLFGSGVRYKILEAFALGTPVVSTTLGCEGLGVEPGKQLLVADTPEAFAGACRDVISNQILRDELISEGRRLVGSVNQRSRNSFAEVLGSSVSRAH